MSTNRLSFVIFLHLQFGMSKFEINKATVELIQSMFGGYMNYSDNVVQVENLNKSNTFRTMQHYYRDLYFRSG